MAILRAGLYERVSSEEQAKFGYSIKTQVEALEEYCAKNNIKIVDHYTDEGVSGGKVISKRPALARMLEDVKEGKIDIILVTRLDRFFRNTKEYFKAIDILEKHRVEWKAIWEDYDSTTANGRMAITIFLAIAQNEREKGSERIKVVFDNKVKNGETILHWRCMPFGYMREIDENGIARMVKNPKLEDALNTFWDIVIKYENVGKAGKYVNAVYGLNRNMKNWYDVSKNEFYTGRYRGIENYCEPYVSYEDFKRFHSKRTIKKTRSNRVYIFSGLIHCPDCGRLLSARSNKIKRRGEYVEYHAYNCKRYKDKLGCSFKKYVGEEKIEAYLLSRFDTLMENEIARVKLERAKPKKKAKPDVAKLREQLRRLNVSYIAGNMEDEEYIAETKELNALIVKTEAEAKEDPAEKDISNLQSVLETDFRTIYQGLSKEDKRRFWRSLIKEIYVDENGIVKSVDFL